MLMAAVILNLLAAAGLLALAGKYLFGPVPADYHGEIFQKTAQPVGDGLVTVLTALYRAMGATAAALAVGVVLLTLFGVRADLFWAKLAVLAMVMVSGVPIVLTTLKVARATGVETPWKPALILSVLGLVAFGLSVA